MNTLSKTEPNKTIDKRSKTWFKPGNKAAVGVKHDNGYALLRRRLKSPDKSDPKQLSEWNSMVTRLFNVIKESDNEAVVVKAIELVAHMAFGKPKESLDMNVTQTNLVEFTRSVYEARYKGINKTTIDMAE